MEWIKKYWTQLLACISFIVALTNISIKVERHEQEIQEIKMRQNTSEQVLTDIRTELAEVNAKVTLLVDGKVKFNSGE